MSKPNYTKLRRFDKQGNVLFELEKPKPQADVLIKNHSTYPSGEKNWELIPDAPKKAMGRPKKEDNEDS